MKYIPSKVLFSMMIVALIASGCGKKEEVKKEEIKNVNATRAQYTNFVTEVEYASKLKPIQEVSISPKSPGKVAEINFVVGQKVNKGDVLFTLDSKEVKAQLAGQKAQADLARINLEKASDSSLKQQISAAEQAQKKAEQNYNSAKYSYENVKTAYQSAGVTQQEMIDAELKFQAAQADLKVARENYDILMNKTGPQSIKSAQAQLLQSEAGVENSMVNLDNTVIRSPITGIVSENNVEIGEFTQAGVPSFKVINTDEMVAEVSVSDRIVEKVFKGQKVNIKIPAYKGGVVEGVLDNISPAADEKSQNYLLKIKMNNQDNALKSGMFTKVILPVETKENLLSVPNTAIKIENGVSYVYKIEGERVKITAVTTGLFNEKITEVTNNLKKGEIIITEGQIFLNEGDRVKVVNGL